MEYSIESINKLIASNFPMVMIVVMSQLAKTLIYEYLGEKYKSIYRLLTVGIIGLWVGYATGIPKEAVASNIAYAVLTYEICSKVFKDVLSKFD